MAENVGPNEMDVAALDLIIENLVKLACETHGDEVGHSMLGGMYLAAMLMNDEQLAPLARRVLILSKDRYPRIVAAYDMIRANLVDEPVSIREPEVDEDYEAWRAERLDDSGREIPPQSDPGLLDGPF